MRVSDALVKQVYEDFKVFAERELRDGDNPNLAACSFNEVPPTTISHILIPLTGVRRGVAGVFADKLEGFRYEGSEIAWEEDEIGKLKYWVQIPIPRPKKKKPRKKHHSRSPSPRSRPIKNGKPSCTRMMASVAMLLIFTMGSLMLNQGQLQLL